MFSRSIIYQLFSELFTQFKNINVQLISCALIKENASIETSY